MYIDNSYDAAIPSQAGVGYMNPQKRYSPACRFLQDYQLLISEYGLIEAYDELLRYQVVVDDDLVQVHDVLLHMPTLCVVGQGMATLCLQPFQVCIF